MKSMPLHHWSCLTFNILLKNDSISVQLVPTDKTCIETRHEIRDRLGPSEMGWFIIDTPSYHIISYHVISLGGKSM